MKRYCRAPTVRMTKLLVGAPLTDFYEAEALKQSDDLRRLQDG